MESQVYFPGVHMYDPLPDEYLQLVKSGRYKNEYEALLARQFELCKKSIEYAKSQQNAMRGRRIKAITKNFDRYNGVYNDKEYAHYNQTYGSDNLARYQDYRLPKTKIDLLLGEFLEREKYRFVKSTNPTAQSELFESYKLMLGLKYAKKEVDKLRQNGIEVLGGMQPLNVDDDKLFAAMTPKDRVVMIMQILFDQNYESMDVLSKIVDGFKDTGIGAEVFFKTEVTESGNTDIRGIDIRDAIFEESDKDPFLQNSPFMGESRAMFPNQIFAGCNLPKRREEKFRKAISAASRTDGENPARGFTRKNGDLMVQTTTIEWKAYKPMVVKLTRNPFRSEPLENLLDDEYYFNERRKIEKDVKKGEYEIMIKYNEYIWEATEFAGGFYHNCREKPNIMRSMQEPSKADFSYTGMVFNSTDGHRVSVVRSIQELGDLFNVSMMIAGRELQKVKGKVLTYDEAMQPEGMTYEQVLGKMINDGIIRLNSASDKAMMLGPGMAGKMASLLQEFDLGLSSSFGQIITFVDKLMIFVDEMTGINQNRQGNIAASSTATNATNSINISRTMTEWLFYMYHRVEKKVMYKFLQCLKVTYGFYKQDEARKLLGDKMATYLFDALDQIPLSDFDIDMSDGKKEALVRQVMNTLLPQSVAAHEMRTVDAMEAQLADSTTKAIAIAKEGWNIVKQYEAEQNKVNADAKSQAIGIQSQAQMTMSNEQRKHDAFMEILKYLLESGKITQEAMNDFKIENPQLFTLPQAQMQAPQQQQPAALPLATA